MNKGFVHHYGKKFMHVSSWYFFALLLICATVCALALRSNNEHMLVLRSDVYSADKNDKNVQASLDKLQSYVTSHMNTDLSAGPDPVYPPIQLKYTYQRLVQAQSNVISQSNSQLYTEAQTYCQQLNPTDFSGHNRVPCIEQYVETHSADAQNIPGSLYEFDFISPTWSPDLAGWSLFASIIAAILFASNFAYRQWFKRHIS